MSGCKVCGARDVTGAKCKYCGTALKKTSVVYHISADQKMKIVRNIVKKIFGDADFWGEWSDYYIGKKEVYKQVEVEGGWWIFKSTWTERQRVADKKIYVLIETSKNSFCDDTWWSDLTISSYDAKYNEKTKKLAKQLSCYTTVEVILK